MEPVNGAAVNQGWELPQSVSEGIADGTEGKDDVKVLTTTVHKVVEKSQGSELCVFVLRLGKWTYRLPLDINTVMYAAIAHMVHAQTT